MSWNKAVFCSAIIAMLVPSAVVASVHAGYWKSATPTGTTFACQGAESESSLNNILRRAGWPVEEGTPDIDWETESAVVVSPSSYYSDREIIFTGLDQEPGALVLRYGFSPFQTEVVSSNSSTFGSRAEGQAETIVVSYKKVRESGRDFRCQSRGLVN